MLRLFLVLSSLFLSSYAFAQDFAVHVDQLRVFLNHIQVLEPFSKQAQRFVDGKDFTISDEKTDRYGDLYADVFFEGKSLQSVFLEHGWARRISGTKFQESERLAQSKNRGIWSIPRYRLKTPENVEFYIGDFQVIKGRVTKTYLAKKVLYINFGHNWKEDFTVMIEKKNLKKMMKTGFDYDNLKDKTVIVRGLVENYYGPMIKVSHIDQLEVLDDKR